MIDITYSNGYAQATTSLEEALTLIRQTYPDAVLYDALGFEVLWEDAETLEALHQDGGRILVWMNEALSRADDGAKAVASLRWVAEGSH